MVLNESLKDPDKAIPSGFRPNGKGRKLKNCMISKIKAKSKSETSLKVAVCITMYNENEQELKNTLKGVILNYNELRNDESLNFKKQDFLVFLICDGFENIPDSFK
jgi:hypothetical protein